MGRKARLKRERRNAAEVIDPAREIRRRLGAMGLDPILVEGPTEERKVSDALLELVQPVVKSLAPHERTNDRLEQVIALGALAWNAYLLPDGDALIADSLARLHLDEETLDVTHELLAVFSERRHALFADDRRLVISTSVTVSPTGEFRVSAAHAPLPDGRRGPQ